MLIRIAQFGAVLAGWWLLLSAARGVEDPLALLSAVQSAYKGADSLTAEVTLSRRTNAGRATVSLRGTAILQKPDKFRLELDGVFGRTMVSDGTNLWTVITEGNRCLKREVGHPRTLSLLGAKPLSLFFAGHTFVFGLPATQDSTTLLAPQTVGSIRCDVVEVTSTVLGRQRIRYFIGPDLLVHRMEAELEVGDQRVEQEVELRQLKLNRPIEPGCFEFMPPANIRVQGGDRGKPLVAVGEIAPEFTLREAEGRPISLAATLQRSEAVWLNFWFLRCAPCVAEFPQLSRLYDEYKTRGLELISINASDGLQDINKFKREKQVRFAMVTAGLRGVSWSLLEVCEYGLLEEYDVRSFPTNLILDRRGRVILRIEGFDEAAIRKALAAAGAGTAPTGGPRRGPFAEPDGTANASQPIGSETNKTSSAAGSRR
jgi:outer membrane lipoprotein-sorting protein/peroxiredoxin